MKFKGNLDHYGRLPFFIHELLNPHMGLILAAACLIAVADSGRKAVGQWLTGSKIS